MVVWLLRLLLLLAILVTVAMISMWAFAAYIIVAATGAADAESERWVTSATIFLAVSSGLIAFGVYGIIKGWKLSKEQQLGKATRWIGITDFAPTRRHVPALGAHNVLAVTPSHQ